jgi:hypothetical protein
MKKTKPKSLSERFWGKVKKGRGKSCWNWQGMKDIDGYGRFAMGGGYVDFQDYERVKKQRDELLAAAKNVIKLVELRCSLNNPLNQGEVVALETAIKAAAEGN